VLKKEFSKDRDKLPSNSQLNSRRHYLKILIIKELSTKADFLEWISKHSKFSTTTKDHQLIILSYRLTADNFLLLYSTKAMLRNLILQEKTGASYLALDTTHKVISCGFKLTVFATTTIQHEIADVAFLVHQFEDTDSYKYGLQELKRFMKDKFAFDWKPKVINSIYS
jgi:hypothetical protein